MLGTFHGLEIAVPLAFCVQLFAVLMSHVGPVSVSHRSLC